MSYFDDASLVMIPSGYKDQKVYSVKPLDGSGDLTFSRASSATRVASNGLIEKVRTNLMTYSNDFTNAAWSAITNGTYTLTTETITDPFGNSVSVAKVTLTSGGYLVLRNVLASSTSSPTTGSVYIKKTNSATGVDIDLSDQPSPAAASNTNWQRLEVVNPSSVYGSGTFLDINITTVNQPVYIAYAQIELSDFGATDYIATTSAAVSVGPVSGLPRLDYLNSTCPRLLLEPQRTNSVTYSEQFNNAAWTKGTGCTVTANQAVSPDGYTNADLISFSQDNTDINQSVSGITSVTATLSVYLKAPAGQEGRTVLFGFAAGEGVVHTLTNQWVRVTVTQTNPPFQGVFIGRYGQTATSVLAWGFQAELSASYATSYIPTLGTSVTRVADAASKTGISSLIGQTEGTLFVDLTEVNDLDFPEITIDNNNNTDRIVLTRSAAGNWGIFVASSAASTYSVYSTTSSTSGKFALAYSSAGYTLYRNGVQIVTGTYDLPAALSAVRLNGRSSSDFYATKKVGQLVIFKTRLSNSDLAALTA